MYNLHSTDNFEERKGRIDVHHHIFADRVVVGKPVYSPLIGYTTPPENLPWTPEKSLAMMDRCGIQFTLLSSPFLNVEGNNSEQVRSDNLVAHEVCKRYPERFGWLASLPNLDYTEG
jgi:hypothetical protein